MDRINMKFYFPNLFLSSAYLVCILIVATSFINRSNAQVTKVRFGVYYFDGWTGQTWHLTQKLKDSFPEREPIWGWTTSTSVIMKAQIDTAVKYGIDFFDFCWYYHAGPDSTLTSDPKNNALKIYLDCKNNNELGFSLMIANHQGYIFDSTAWPSLCTYWCSLFHNKSYEKVNGMPFISFFSVSSLLKTFGDSVGVKNAFRVFKRMAVIHGLKGVQIAACVDPSKTKMEEAISCGFDIITQYNNHQSGFSNQKYDVTPVSNLQLAESRIRDSVLSRSIIPVIPVVTLNYDVRPWEPLSQSSRYTGFSSVSVKSALSACTTWLNANPKHVTREKIALIYAWNEYGEGAWLTPSSILKSTLLSPFQTMVP